MPRIFMGLIIFFTLKGFVTANDASPEPTTTSTDYYPGEAGREVINAFVERELRWEDEEALRRALDIWAVNCRRHYRSIFLSREIKNLLRWLENPKNKNYLPPPDLCGSIFLMPYSMPYYSNRFLARNYWRLMTKEIRRRQVKEGRLF